MMKNYFCRKQIVVILLLLAFLNACASQTPVQTTTITLSPTSESISTIIPTATFTTFPTQTPTRKPTRIPTNVPETPLPTQTEEPIYLYVREPSIEQLDKYLGQIYTQYEYNELSENAILIYEDVNGDNEADLVVDDWLQVVVLLWDKDHYIVYRLGYPFEKYDPSSRVLLEDWTNDGIPDIVFDYRGDTGGTGVKHSYWDRHIIHCQEISCDVVWKDKMAALSQENGLGGMDLYKAKAKLTTNSSGDFVLRYSSNVFAVYSPGFYLPFDIDWNTYNYDYLNVYTSTLSTYLWNGEKFELVNDEIIKLPYSIDGESSMSAYGPQTVPATITVESNSSADRNNDVCVLYINGTAVGNPFGCKDNFTTVEWRDITGDGLPEVAVMALSGPQPFDKDGQQLSDANCVHQRFLAYNWNGKIATEIANIAGCVVDESLYGVHLEDYTNDGVLEVLTPSSLFISDEGCEIDNVLLFGGNGCWYEIADDPGLRIYKFNGTKYILWSDIPSQ